MEYTVLIGCGGREHAIANKLFNRVNILTIGNYINPAIDKLSKKYIVSDLTNESILKHCRNYIIKYVIIGPEAPLDNKLADEFLKKNIPVIGPTFDYAKIETDKHFCRFLLNKYNLDEYSPKYRLISYKDKNRFDSLFNDIISEIPDFVIKPCKLKSGKGVKVYKEHFNHIDEAKLYIKQILDLEENVLIEERLIGEEFSLMSFTDSICCKHMPIVKDYKRAFDGDKGPNTGSMGSVSFNDHSMPFLTKDDVNSAKMINEIVVQSLNNYYKYNMIDNITFDYAYDRNSELDNSNLLSPNGSVFIDDINIGYKGILYGSFIKTRSGIKIIEYNARFGDPEAINVLSILETNLNEIFTSIIHNRLNTKNIIFSNESTICKYIVPNGYPTNPVKNEKIEINQEVPRNTIIYSSIEEKDNKLYLKGSRALALIERHKYLNVAQELINETSQLILGPVFSRSDIGRVRLSYSDCGVSIDRGNDSLKKIKRHVSNTFNDKIIHRFGDFAGLINGNNLENDLVLIGSIDGVGTKTSFLPELLGKDAYEILGQDIVNHSINDILVKNAKPLLFMDYIASSSLDPDVLELILKGMSKSCKIHNCPILGGETAEMPGVYKEGEYDIVGTIVGYADKNKLIDGKINVKEGSKIIAIKSNGPHTNGYSMIRKIFKYNSIETQSKEFIKWLTNPHKSYYSEVNELLSNDVNIQGLCHVTGGGLIENPPRVINDDLRITFELEISKEFKILQELGNISNYEMLKTFNCGIGMLVFIDDNDVKKTLEILNKNEITSYVCGIVSSRKDNTIPQINFI